MWLAEIDLHWHGLRHEAACRWLAGGLDLRAIQLLLGDADIKTTQRYLNVTDEEHPFIERLIGTVRRECLDRTLFWTAGDLEVEAP